MSISTISEGFSIIIPVFNEEKAIESTVSEIKATLHSKYIYEIVLVNDGSTDGTGTVLKKIKGENIRIIEHKVNRGYGATLKTGIAHAKHDWFVITDSDGTYPIESIPSLIESSAGYDMVIGARTGLKVSDTLPRKIGRGIVRTFASYIARYKIKDINSGLRLFSRSLAKQFWHLYPEGFSFTSTITVGAHMKKYAVKYVPIDYKKRTGSSSINPLKDFTGFMSLIFRLAVYFNPLRVFVPLALFVFIAAFLVLIIGITQFDTVLDASVAILLITSIQILLFGFVADMIVKRFSAA